VLILSLSQRLASLLRLPEVISIQDAKIRLLRLTIPADIHASGICFEAEGAHFSLSVNTQELVQPSSRAPKRAGHRKPGLGADTAAGGTRAVGLGASEDTTSRSPRGKAGYLANEGIPTAADLAQSFVDTEPAEEKAQLKAAVANARNLEESTLSESLELDSDEGYGSPLSLPGFVADFLQGVQARAEVHIKEVQVDICLKLDLSSFGSQTPPQGDFEDIRLRFSIDSFDLHPLTTNIHSQPSDAGQHAETNGPAYGKRRIHAGVTRAIFLSDSSILSFMAQFSGPPSPTATHVSSFKTVSRVNSGTEPSPASMDPPPRQPSTPDLASSGRALETVHPSLPVASEEQEESQRLERAARSIHSPLKESLRSDLESESDEESASRFSTSYHEAELQHGRSSREIPVDNSPRGKCLFQPAWCDITNTWQCRNDRFIPSSIPP
jgi:autophagy-related protein 2